MPPNHAVETARNGKHPRMLKTRKFRKVNIYSIKCVFFCFLWLVQRTEVDVSLNREPRPRNGTGAEGKKEAYYLRSFQEESNSVVICASNERSRFVQASNTAGLPKDEHQWSRAFVFCQRKKKKEESSFDHFR